jgi:hypothetical protein
MFKLSPRLLARAARIAGYNLNSMLNPLGSVWQRAPLLMTLERTARVPRVIAQDGVPIDRALVARALRFFERVPAFYGDDTPAPLAIRGAWRSLLTKERAKQLECIANKDVDGYLALATHLFSNELSSGLANFGVTPIGRPVRFELRVDCEAFERVSDRSVDALATNSRYPAVGMPVEKGVVRNSDPQHGVQATHILNLAKALRIPTDELVLLDLGSGYGGLSEKIHAWCASPPLQILVDIPLNLTTAYIYLAHTFSEDAVLLIDDPKGLAQVDRKRVKFLLVPSCYTDELAKRFEWHMVHNAKSFSEMDADTVAYYVSRLIKPSTSAFIETNSNRKGSTNYGEHREVLARNLPVPDSHVLLSRFPDTRMSRYVTSVYLNRALFAAMPLRHDDRQSA